MTSSTVPADTRPARAVAGAADWRPDIDGLRAVAVLTVITFHAFPRLIPGGFIGVDVFFVISGYLITSILWREQLTGKFSIVRFYERRARRLFPALAVVLLVTMLAVFAVGYPSSVIASAKHGAASAFSAANVVFWREAGYFDTASHLKPFLNLWSLGVEEQFYIFWPLMLVALFRLPRLLLFALVVACVVSFSSAEWLNTRYRDAVFYLPMFRLWELGAGAMLALLVARGVTSQRWLSARTSASMATVGLFVIVACALILDSSRPFPGFWAAPAILGSCMIVWSGTRDEVGRESIAAKLLCHPVAVYIGAVSYSLYLWHWPLLVVPAIAGIELSMVQRLAAVLAAFVLAAATLRWIEQPFRYSRQPRRAALQAVLLLVAAGGVCAAIYAFERRENNGPARTQLQSALAWPSARAQRGSCPDALLRVEPLNAYCQLVRPGQPDAVVWGDSHADHLFPGLKAADPSQNWMLLGHMSCPPTIGIDVIADQAQCAARSEAALRWIESQASIRTVVVAFFGSYAADTDFAHAHVNGPSGPAKTSVDGSRERVHKERALARGVKAAVERLRGAGKRVVLVLDVPELPFAPHNCFARPRLQVAEPKCSVTRDEVVGRQQWMRSMAAAIQKEWPDVIVVDPLPALCNASECGVSQGGAPIYRDSHHLSASGSAIVARRIADAMTANR